MNTMILCFYFVLFHVVAIQREGDHVTMITHGVYNVLQMMHIHAWRLFQNTCISHALWVLCHPISLVMSCNLVSLLGAPYMKGLPT